MKKTTTAMPFGIKPFGIKPFVDTTEQAYEKMQDERAAAVDEHRADLERLLPNLRTRMVAGCLQRAQFDACAGYSSAVFENDVMPLVADELAAAGVPVEVAADYADEVLFGPRGTDAVSGARRAAAGESLKRVLPEVAKALRRLMKARA